jgi:hypothetical protein
VEDYVSRILQKEEQYPPVKPDLGEAVDIAVD